MKKLFLNCFAAFCAHRADLPRQLLPADAPGGVRIGFALISIPVLMVAAGAWVATLAWAMHSVFLGIVAGWILRSALVQLRPLTSAFQWGFEQAAREQVEKN